MARPRWLPAIAAVTLLAACGRTPAPSADASASAGPTPPPASCAADLPPRDSPTDFPIAVLHLAGDDLPPVIGDVEWTGGAEPIATSPARPVHVQRFTVLQARGREAFGIRMTDDVEIDAWEIWAVPNQSFRAGDYETGRVVWSEGRQSTPLVCVPLVDGQWLVGADLTYADGAGTASFYWRINVIETPERDPGA